jgi:hypothetical protein
MNDDMYPAGIGRGKRKTTRRGIDVFEQAVAKKVDRNRSVYDAA